MKKKITITTFLIISIAVIVALFMMPVSLNSRLDDLEDIISKYEPLFASVQYGSQEYTDMVADYNAEIFAWAEEFEMQRYKRDGNNKILYDENNKPKLNSEFSDEVEKRFYMLNNRMTKMVLSSVPKKEETEF